MEKTTGFHAAACGLLLAIAVPCGAQGGTASAEALARCRALADNAARLACFDAAVPVAMPAPALPPAAAAAPSSHALVQPRAELLAAPSADSERSLIGDRWGLGASPDDDRFDLRAHRPTYLLLGRYSDNVNHSPFTPTRVTPPVYLDLDQTEAKFQLSFKLKLFDLGRSFDMPLSVWAAYTQQSQWQVYNGDNSRPFRETNYEPELFAAVHPDVRILGWRWRLAAIGLNHQSNGRAEPLSRSWNRLVAQFGVERGNMAVIVRPWVRVRENNSRDDNPDITRYLGHGDITFFWAPGQHSFSLTGRGNLGSGKGAAQAHWTFPLARRVRGIVQVFSGYGESLIDYNMRQTTFGLGISLADHL